MAHLPLHLQLLSRFTFRAGFCKNTGLCTQYTKNCSTVRIINSSHFLCSLRGRSMGWLHIALFESCMDVHFMTAGSWAQNRFHFILWIHILIRLFCICLILKEVLKTTIVFPNLVHTFWYAKNFNISHILHFTVRVNKFCTQNPCLLLSMWFNTERENCSISFYTVWAIQ